MRRFAKVSKRCSAFVSAGFMLVLAFCAISFAVETRIPFFPGERLTFHVWWSFLPAGEAVLEVLPLEAVNGMPAYHFVMTAKTRAYIDPFYKVRDRIEAYTDSRMTRSILYKKRRKGKSKKNVVVQFDWEKQIAQYSNFGEKIDPIPILPGSFDPLSVFYAFRLYDLEAGLEIRTPVTDGKKSVPGRAKVVKREKIKVAGGEFDTYLVEPDLEHIGGVFTKSKNAKLQIWVTADEKRIPVRIKSKVVVGSFVAELYSIE